MASRAVAAATVLSLLLVTLAHGEGDVPVYGGDAKARFGHPRELVEPAYPEEAQRQGRGGSVTVTGPINPTGGMDQPSIAADTPASEEFVNPVRDVLNYWLFDTPYDNDCMPSARPVRIKVDFEAREGKPHIYVTVAAETVPPEWAGSIGTRQVPRIHYPPAMIRENREAVLFSRSEIGPDGNVRKVVSRAYLKPGSKPGDLEPFVTEVERTVSQWTYPANPAKPLRKVCHTILFNLLG